MRLRPRSSVKAAAESGPMPGHFADELALATLSTNRPEVSIDRSLAPPSSEPLIQLPACSPQCQHQAERATAQVEGKRVCFLDMIPDDVLAALTFAEHAALAGPRLEHRARRYIDIAEQAAPVVDPGFQDLARVRCGTALAFILYLLGPRDGCACYAALVAAVPQDEPIGIFARARAASRTPPQVEELRTQAERRAEASVAFSAYFRQLSEQRRRPIPGDLFAAFDTDVAAPRPRGPRT